MRDHGLSLISEERRNRILRFRKPLDEQRSLLADLLVRSRICDLLQMDNEEIHFDYENHGRPFLRGADGFHFNASHSGKWIIGAFSSLPVGVDVQRIGIVNIRLAKRFFSEQENADLLKRSEENRADFFYELWTLKESYLKAIGSGLTVPLSSFTVKEVDGFIRIESQGKTLPFHLKQYEIDEEHKIAVCATESRFSERIEVKEIDEIVAGLGSR